MPYSLTASIGHPAVLATNTSAETMRFHVLHTNFVRASQCFVSVDQEPRGVRL